MLCWRDQSSNLECSRWPKCTWRFEGTWVWIHWEEVRFEEFHLNFIFGYHKVSSHMMFSLELNKVSASITDHLISYQIKELDGNCTIWNQQVYNCSELEFICLNLLNMILFQGTAGLWICPVCRPGWCWRCQILYGWANSPWSWIDSCLCWREQKETLWNEGKRAFQVRIVYCWSHCHRNAFYLYFFPARPNFVSDIYSEGVVPMIVGGPTLAVRTTIHPLLEEGVTQGMRLFLI